MTYQPIAAPYHAAYHISPPRQQPMAAAYRNLLLATTIRLLFSPTVRISSSSTTPIPTGANRRNPVSMQTPPRHRKPMQGAINTGPFRRKRRLRRGNPYQVPSYHEHRFVSTQTPSRTKKSIQATWYVPATKACCDAPAARDEESHSGYH